MTKSRDVLSQGLLSWAVRWLHLLYQALWCYVSTRWSPGLHRGYGGCHRHRHRGDLWDSWCGRDSCGLWLWSHWHCRCNRCRWHGLCRPSGCKLWHRDMGPGRRLQCGYCGLWDSVSGLYTTLTEVLSCVVVNSTIAGAYLVAVLG